MFKSVKRNLIFLIILAVIFTSTGVFFTYKLLKSKDNNEPWIVSNIDGNSTKFISKETLIKDIKSKRELITTEIDLEETLTINDSWGQFEVFKKLQTIHFFGRGIYYIDLSTLDDSSLVENKKGKSLTLKLSSPSIKTIVIDEEKTLYESPDMGILRFGEVKLTPSEYEVILNHIKTEMKTKLLQEEFYKRAKEESQNSIKKLLASLCNIDEDKIFIDFQ